MRLHVDEENIRKWMNKKAVSIKPPKLPKINNAAKPKKNDLFPKNKNDSPKLSNDIITDPKSTKLPKMNENGSNPKFSSTMQDKNPYNAK